MKQILDATAHQEVIVVRSIQKTEILHSLIPELRYRTDTANRWYLRPTGA